MPDITQDMTLAQWIPLWLESYKQGTIKDKSYHQLELLVRLIPEDLKAKTLSEILPLHLQAFYNQFAQTASKSYMDKMRVLVNALFRDAVDNDLCSRDPTTHLRVPHIAEVPRQSYTKEEVRAILYYAMGCDQSRIAIAVMMLLLTGLRRGELLGLKWSDLQDNMITINRAVFVDRNGKAMVEEHRAKTFASLRAVPLIPELAHHLSALPQYGEFVFAAQTGGIWHPRNFSRDYDRFFARLREVEPWVRRLSPHACRHTFATLSLDSGSNIRVVQSMLGHTDIKTTSRYTHPDTGSMLRAMEGLRSGLIDSR